MAVLAALVWAATELSTQRIFIIGDSTVCNYGGNKYPMTGWGQVLGLFFNSGSVEVHNHAIGGRSSRSFYQEGRWNSVLENLHSGDIVLIQFGHNDRDYSKEERYTDTTHYKEYLGKYVDEARAKGAVPIFVTPMNMNTWINATTVREVFCEANRGADYRGAMLNVGHAKSVPVLDLEKKSKTYMESLGQAYMSKFHFLGLDAGEYVNYPDGINDGTHFQEMGALANARMILEEIERQKSLPGVSVLASLAKALYSIDIKSNFAAGGDTLTTNGAYPAGATVTIKVRPQNGTFQHWVDAQGQVVSTERIYSFVQGAENTSFTAVFAQGTPVEPPQSSAAVSSSEPASSSSYAEPQSVVQAENMCDGQGLLENNHAGHHGAGFWNFTNEVGSSMLMIVEATASQSTTLQIYYANGTAQNRPMELRINGGDAVRVEFPSTGAWDAWHVVEVPLNLSGGRDSLWLLSLEADGGPNVDQLGFLAPDINAASCEDEAPVTLKPRVQKQPNYAPSHYDLLGRPRSAENN